MKLLATNILARRRGSTLVIVISLLGLLAFTGMVFYTFAAQERIASEYFSEAAKATYDEPADVWPHMLEQILVGAPEQYRGSKFYSSSRRHSIVRNMVGSDIYPHSGDGVTVDYSGSGSSRLPTISGSTTVDDHGQSLIEFVDSPSVWRGRVEREGTPEPDVDYTYPDINNLFLAYRGWAIRSDGGGGYTEVPVIIPSFFRPQYMRTSPTDSSDVNNLSLGAQKTFGTTTYQLPTNPGWAYSHAAGTMAADPPTIATVTDANRNNVEFQRRSFRPHPADIVGLTSGGGVVYRYIADDESIATDGTVAAGGFPFLPEDLNSNGLSGDLGIWTAAQDSTNSFDAEDYELDKDNDLDGIREGIWMDLHFPVQEFVDSSSNTRKYVVLHSVTIYDLDGLLNLNIHGNLAGLRRDGTIPDAVAAGDLTGNSISRSHHGLGPNEVNPIWALRRNTPLSALTEEQMFIHMNAVPSNELEAANVELMWLLMGRGEYDNYTVTRDPMTNEITAITGEEIVNLHGGRWGDKNLLYSSLEEASPRLQISEMPRPGRAGNVYRTISSGPAYDGRDGVDDNQDGNEGEGFTVFEDHDGDSMTPNIGVVYRRPFGHPVSWSGVGGRTQVDEPYFNPATSQFVFDSSVAGSGTDHFSDEPLLPLRLRDTASPGAAQWPGYFQYGASNSGKSEPYRHAFGVDQTYDGTNAFFLTTGGADDLNHNPFFDRLLEDPLETVVDHEFEDRVNDGIAAIGDLIALQWPVLDGTRPETDITTTDLSQHLTNLAPHALDPSSDRREMFTTLSNSLRYVAMQRHPRREWEFSADTDNDNRFEFPPQFGTVTPYSSADPFRPQVRRILTQEVGESRELVGALPISINHLLDVERSDETPAEGTTQFVTYMDRAGLRFRSLTEHPHITNYDSDGTDAIDETDVITIELPATTDSDNNTVESVADVAYPPTNFSEQEFWARRDRQQLARDIFVLLYTVGGGRQSGTNIADYSGANNPDGTTPLYTHEQLRRMAQFAVNMVDAMDADNVITKFEYDKNLGDGWNLDDDPYSEESTPLADSNGNYDTTTVFGMFPEDSVTRGVVYGVEAQELAFSEVLAFTSPEISSGNHDATLNDDTAGERNYLFMELRNTKATNLNLATSVSANESNGIFRVVRVDREMQDDPFIAPSGPTAAITFAQDVGTIAGGEHFTISTASNADLASSDFYLDHNLDGSFELIAPDIALGTLPTDASSLPTDPQCDLDLVHSNHSTNRFTLTDSSQAVVTAAGAFLDTLHPYGGNQALTDLRADAAASAGTFATDTREGFDLVIQRRLNPHMPSLTASSGQSVDINPWVEVDRIRVLFDGLGLADADVASDLPGRLENIKSWERREVLNDFTRRRSHAATTPTDYRYNTVGADVNEVATNSGSVVHEEVWQPHFDRDFVSPAELLGLPVFGPSLTTQRLSYSRLAPFQQTQGDTVSTANICSAESMFLWPRLDPAAANSDEDNRWYRLFQFVEVPSRVNRMLGNYLSRTRLPGKINLNTIRHLEVFAGMIDDPYFADLRTDANRRAPFLNDANNIRDRWHLFVDDRDGGTVQGYYDLTPADTSNGDEATEFKIPGVPGSEPFRSFGFHSETTNDNGLESTILRKRKSDREDNSGTPDATSRNWLEVGTTGNHASPAVATTQFERHQVLSKIMNNTTTVSNCFVVFATAGYFEAYEDPSTGLVRVGGQINIDTGDPITSTNASDAGSQQRAVFVIDRTEAYKAFDQVSGDFDWQRLVTFEAEIN